MPGFFSRSQAIVDSEAIVEAAGGKPGIASLPQKRDNGSHNRTLPVVCRGCKAKLKLADSIHYSERVVGGRTQYEPHMICENAGLASLL